MYQAILLHVQCMYRGQITVQHSARRGLRFGRQARSRTSLYSTSDRRSIGINACERIAPRGATSEQIETSYSSSKVPEGASAANTEHGRRTARSQVREALSHGEGLEPDKYQATQERSESNEK